MSAWSRYLSKDTMIEAYSLYKKVEEERENGHIIYPPQQDIFKALKLTQPESVKVVIIGQDPYHEEGQANGLAFSVNPGISFPPSLKNIFKELHNDIGCDIPETGDLTKWAENGILLLNTVLTVEQGMPNSHANLGWQNFVQDIFEACLNLPQPVVFLLWGRQAKGIMGQYTFSNYSNKEYYATSHPSPLGATKGNMSTPAFLGSRTFSVANRLLKSMGGEPVDWSL